MNLKINRSMNLKINKRVWCYLKKKYYSSKADKVGRSGEIVGESRNKDSWRVRWEGIKSAYSYPKNYIKIEDKK